jgi:hypothetical protein
MACPATCSRCTGSKNVFKTVSGGEDVALAGKQLVGAICEDRPDMLSAYLGTSTSTCADDPCDNPKVSFCPLKCGRCTSTVRCDICGLIQSAHPLQPKRVVKHRCAHRETGADIDDKEDATSCTLAGGVMTPVTCGDLQAFYEPEAAGGCFHALSWTKICCAAATSCDICTTGASVPSSMQYSM